MQKNGIRDIPFTLQPGVPSDFVNIPGNWIAVKEAIGDVTIRVNYGQRSFQRQAGEALTADYSTLQVESPIAQTVIMSLGFGETRDARATVNANVTAIIAEGNTLPPGGDVVVPAGGSAILLAGDATRLTAILQNLGNATLRIGGSGVGASSGVPLVPGEKFGLDGTAVIAAFNPDVVPHSVAVLPLRQV